MNEDILEGNKLIAEFDGWETYLNTGKYYCESRNISFLKELHEFKYDTSWSCLMPVVEKIEKEGAHYTIGANKYCDIVVAKENPENEFDCFDFYVTTETDPIYGKYQSKIEALWLAVIEFIKWYNSIKAENISVSRPKVDSEGGEKY